MSGASPQRGVKRGPGPRISPPPIKRRIQSATTSSAVASFFKPLSQKEPDKTTWTTISDTLLIARYVTGSTTTIASLPRVAAFDLDGTLVTTKSGKQYAKEEDDWKWWAPEVPSTLKKLHETGFRVAILTNQNGLTLNPGGKKNNAGESESRTRVFKKKVSTILNQLDIPITLLAATERDRFRKPCTGMWEELLEDIPSVDLDQSFFVGDAGGRAADAKVKKDFSCSDRNLAANIGIRYHTPEEYFLGQPPKQFIRDFDPAAYFEADTDTLTEWEETVSVVLFCGSPGAGKSTFYWNQLQPKGYERVNQDLLKTRERCIEHAISFLSAGRSVVVDNTNADRAVRKVWIELASKYKVKIRCLHFTAPASLCQHNNMVRALNDSATNLNPESRTLLPGVAFTSFKSRFQEPALSEGFDSICRVNFKFQGSEETRRVWGKYWI